MAEAALRMRDVAPPAVRIDGASFPIRHCSVWLIASAITAAAVAYATGHQHQNPPQATFQVASASAVAVPQIVAAPQTVAVAETVASVEMPAASAETKVYRRPPQHSFVERWGKAGFTSEQVDASLATGSTSTGSTRPAPAPRLARQEPVFPKQEPAEEPISTTTLAYAAPTDGFSLASADSRAIELSTPAPLVTKPAPLAKSGKPEFDEVEEYLWEVYQRAPVKKDGSGDFTWKDPAAAKRMGLGMQKYVISGMDPDFREQLYHLGKALDAEGVKWTILSAFRDDYRQQIASGIKASAKNSLHGGSVRTGGYGHGRAVDITSIEGDPWDVWEWVDYIGAKYGLHRPMPSYDPAHIQQRGDARKIAQNLRSQRIQLAKGQDPKAKVASAGASAK